MLLTQMGGVPFAFTDGGRRPARFSVVHGLNPADLPAIRLQFSAIDSQCFFTPLFS
jgi:hypothetical protein